MLGSALDKALVIAVEIDSFEIRRILVGKGSSADILYYKAFKKVCLDEMKLVPVDALLIKFNGRLVWPCDSIAFTFELGIGAKISRCMCHLLTMQ